MPLAFFKTLTVSAAVTNAIAAAQTLVAAGPLVLSASPYVLPNAGQRPSLTSTGNLSAVNFTAVGLGVDGNPLTLAIAGPNNNTVNWGSTFTSITSITADAAVGTNVSAGYAAVAETKMWQTDPRMNPFQIGFGAIVVSGAPSMTMQHTFDQIDSSAPAPGTPGVPFNQALAQWFNHPSVTSQTTTIDGNYGKPVSAIRFVVSGAGVARIAGYQSVGGP